jgi:RimJ/RimL family protein N-acetyltransferase
MIIRSARLEMTPLTKEDWLLFQMLHNTEQVIAQCFDPLPDTVLQQKFQQRLVPWHKEAEHWQCLVIRQHDTSEAMGVTGMCLSQGRAEVGYLLLPAFYGQGFGTESLKGLMQWAAATHGISHFKAVVTEGNSASERVLQKVGFQLVAKVAEAHSIAGKRYTDHIYHFDA